MATAVIYGLLASSSFVVGVLLGLATKPPRRLLAVAIAFGAGVLVSALTFDLMGEAFERETGAYAIGGFLVGAVIYVLADAGLERLAARSPKRTGRDPQDVVPGAVAKPESKEVAATTGLALLVGALIDGIPESAAIGLSLHAEGRSLGLVLLAAVFLANVPESLASTGAMREEGRSRGYIIGVWTGVAVACVLATVAGYALLAGLSPGWVSAVLALAAGGSWRCWPTRCSPRPLSMAAGGSRWPPPWASPAPSCSANSLDRPDGWRRPGRYGRPMVAQLFLAVAALAVLGIFLRQRGSPESKPVAAPHAQTGTS